MASLSTTLPRFAAASCHSQFNGLSRVSFVAIKKIHLVSESFRRLRISCEAGSAPPAKPETLQKVIDIVTRQLAATEGTVHPHSKFQELGADSLDQVEIVMALEEEFKISVDEDGAESILTVQDAANLIEKVTAKV